MANSKWAALGSKARKKVKSTNKGGMKAAKKNRGY